LLFCESLLDGLFEFVVHNVRFLHVKNEISNVSIERKCRSNSRGAWSLKNAEKIKNLFGWNGRGNDQSRE
jgi:hypothetical protein